jgi:hypothetical protein
MTDKHETIARLEALHAATIDALVELSQALKDAQESGDDDAIEAAERAIDEDPLSVQVRDGWYTPGAESTGPEEFEILLSTGGPASRIRGQLDDHGYPENFHIEVQDWFQPWQSFVGLTGAQGDLIRDYYLSRFYFSA